MTPRVLSYFGTAFLLLVHQICKNLLGIGKLR